MQTSSPYYRRPGFGGLGMGSRLDIAQASPAQGERSGTASGLRFTSLFNRVTNV